WVGEGPVPEYDAGARVDRRRSLLSRLRFRGQQLMEAARDAPDDGYDEFQQPAAPTPPPSRAEPPPRRASTRPEQNVREPRHVRAVPTSIEHKTSSAVDLF